MNRKPEKDWLAASLVDDLQVACCHEGCKWTGNEMNRKCHQRNCEFKPKKDQSECLVNEEVEVMLIEDEDEKEKVVVLDVDG